MKQPQGVVVPPASIRRPLMLVLVFGALFAWSVSALVANWTFSPALRDDLLLGALGAAVLVSGVVFYLALGTVILDVGQAQLTVDDKGIKSPAFPLFGWEEIRAVDLRRRGGLFSRHDCQLELTLVEEAACLGRLSLLQRLGQRRSLSRGEVVITGQGWPMETLQGAIEAHLVWHRQRCEARERKLVRYLGERMAPPGERQQVA